MLAGAIEQSNIDGKPAGPLRVWPGGLAMSRTIGDHEAGNLVIAEPEIRQVGFGVLCVHVFHGMACKLCWLVCSVCVHAHVRLLAKHNRLESQAAVASNATSSPTAVRIGAENVQVY